jgi:hypothetical protein
MPKTDMPVKEIQEALAICGTMTAGKLHDIKAINNSGADEYSNIE